MSINIHNPSRDAVETLTTMLCVAGCMRRRHISLLRSLVADAGASVVPVHTILEVYRVAPGMPLVRVLPSAQDEVNAATFHPFQVRKGGFRVLG